MEEITRCEICNREFKDAESLAMHNKSKHPEKIPKEKRPFQFRKIRNWGIFLIIAGLIFYGIFLSFSNIKTLPPTDILGHIESNPSSHVLKEPMSLEIQKHMLEHADGIEGGRGGVIINYNCKDYECEDGLIETLESFANKYDYVYMAPFKNMDAKIALTKLNKIEILEEYGEKKIEEFINS